MKNVLFRTSLIVSLFFAPSLYPQEPGSLLNEEFYSLERQNWLDKIKYEMNYQQDTSFDVKFYDINLEIEPDTQYIQCNFACRLVSNTNGLTQVNLQFSNNFEIDSISGDVADASVIDDTLQLTLNRPYNPGEVVSFNMSYSGIPLVLQGTKGMRFETHGNNEPIIATLSTPYLAHLWFPCKDGPGDKADSAYVSITIPDTVINGNQLIGVSNGTLTEIDTNGGKITYRWKELYPIVPYYIMAAVSNYSHFQQIISDTSGNHLPIDYYVFKEDSLSAYQGTLNLPDAINFFIDRFGPYPFENEKYGMTQLGFYGAIENQTNTIQNNLSSGWFMTSVHELSHMWFGDMITCANWHHGWLNEGFASYCEALYTEHTSGFNAYKNYMSYFRYTSGGTVYINDISDPFGIFINIIYEKGAWVLHMLRGILGDETFFNALSAYSADPRFRYDHAATEDFKEVCETVSGTDLDYFFDEWIYDEYYPQYTYYYFQDEITHQLTLQLNQIQGMNGWREVFKMPVKIRINLTDGSDTLITVMNDRADSSYSFSLSGSVSSIQIDPDNWILKTATMITSVERKEEKLPAAFKLESNYPNPFNPTTNIEYRLPSSEFVTLKIYDVLGNEVAVLIHEEKPAGSYKVKFDGSNLPSGVYFYRLRAGKYSDTKKLILMK